MTFVSRGRRNAVSLCLPPQRAALSARAQNGRPYSEAAGGVAAATGCWSAVRMRGGVSGGRVAAAAGCGGVCVWWGGQSGRWRGGLAGGQGEACQML